MTGNELKTIRLNQGISQQKFGEILGYKPSCARIKVYEMEKERRPISSRTETLVTMFLERGILKR